VPYLVFLVLSYIVYYFYMGLIYFIIILLRFFIYLFSLSIDVVARYILTSLLLVILAYFFILRFKTYILKFILFN